MPAALRTYLAIIFSRRHQIGPINSIGLTGLNRIFVNGRSFS